MKDSLKKILNEEIIDGTIRDILDMSKKKTPLPSEIRLVGADISYLKYCKNNLKKQLSARNLNISVCIGSPINGNYSVNVGEYLKLNHSKVS